MASVIVRDVHVDFPIYGTQHLSLKKAIFQRATGGSIHGDPNNDRVLVRALNGIDFTLSEGDRLGLIGHNGSGKSTLLKAMAGIYEPVQGSILVEGRVTPLFDMMPGLDVEDSGYENILTSGMLLGMTRDYIEDKIPEIEEFCELGEYLSLPVRTYSAGMMTRLGFALVTALNPDILLMDEGFGAADLRFTEKSAERMDEFIGRSRIMVLASHSDAMLSSICNKLAWLNEGKLVEIGPVDEVFDKYHESVQRKSGKETQATKEECSSNFATKENLGKIPVKLPFVGEDIREFQIEDRLSRTSGAVRFTKLHFRNADGEVRWSFQPGETLVVHAEYEAFHNVSSLAALLRFTEVFATDEDNPERIVTDILEVVSAETVTVGQKGAIRFLLTNLRLRPGKFGVYVSLVSADNSVGYDVIDHDMGAPPFVVRDESGVRNYLAGVVSIDYSFESI